MSEENEKKKWYHDTEGDVSSKRIFGAIAMIVFMVSAIVLNVISVQTGNDVGSNAADLMTSVGYVAAVLLGVSVAERFGKK